MYGVLGSHSEGRESNFTEIMETIPSHQSLDKSESQVLSFESKTNAIQSILMVKEHPPTNLNSKLGSLYLTSPRTNTQHHNMSHYSGVRGWCPDVFGLLWHVCAGGMFCAGGIFFEF